MTAATKQAIPFTTFRGTLKQLRLSNVGPVAARLFRETFPQFFSTREIPENSASIKELVESMSPKFRYTETLDPPRRFSGEPTLRRGCFYTVCRTDVGDDCGTLLNEVKAYRDPVVCGRVHVLDSGVQRNPFTGEKANALLVVWQDAARSRYVTELLALQDAPQDDTEQLVALEYPYDIIKATIDDVVDLRYPHVRDWFYETFSSEQEDETIMWLARRIPPSASATEREAITEQCVTRQSRFRVTRGVPPVPGSFREMLPTLLNPDIGGGSAADSGSSLQAIGTWLRQRNASALLYPSARSDAFVRVEDGKVHDFGGWNLVDYRSDRRRRKEIFSYIETSPWCWTEFSPGIHLDEPPEAGANGSFRVRGMEAYWRKDYEGILSALASLDELDRSDKAFGHDAKLTAIGAWRLGAASIQWLTQNAVERDKEGAIQSKNLFKGFLIRLGERQIAGLVNELSETLPRTQDIARAISESLGFADQVAESLANDGCREQAATLVVSNRLHVLGFFVSGWLVALKAGAPIERRQSAVSPLLQGYHVERCGLSSEFCASISALFSRGLELVEGVRGDEYGPLHYEQWLRDVSSIEPDKESSR